MHVTVNDGTREIRAVLLPAGSGARVALELPGAFAGGFTFPGLNAQYTLKRLTNGSAVLSVPGSGQPEVVISPSALSTSQGSGKKTIEFGTYDVPAASRTHWNTLGLPAAPVDMPFAQFAPSGLSIKVYNNIEDRALRGFFEFLWNAVNRDRGLEVT